MGLFSKKKNEEVAIDELTPQIKTKLDELAQKGNQFEEEEQYEEAIQAWKEALIIMFRQLLFPNSKPHLRTWPSAVRR